MTMRDDVRQLEAREAQIRQRIAELQEDLDATQAALHKAARQRPQSSVRPPKPCAIRLTVPLPARKSETVPSRMVRPKTEAPSTDPVPLLRGSPCGNAWFIRERDEEGEPAVALFVRAGGGRLARLGANPPVEFRAGLLGPEGVDLALVLVLVRIGTEVPDDLYEGWVNECPQGLEEALELLAYQPDIAIHLYGEDCRRERTVRVPNPLQEFARESLRVVADALPCTPDDFYQARNAVYKQYRSVWSLWRAMKT